MHLYLYNADRAENQNLVSALSITINKILCQFFEFTQNLKRFLWMFQGGFEYTTSMQHYLYNPCPAGFLSSASVNKEIINYFIRIFEKSLKLRVLGAFLYALLYEDFVKI